MEKYKLSSVHSYHAGDCQYINFALINMLPQSVDSVQLSFTCHIYLIEVGPETFKNGYRRHLPICINWDYLHTVQPRPKEIS